MRGHLSLAAMCGELPAAQDTQFNMVASGPAPPRPAPRPRPLERELCDCAGAGAARPRRGACVTSPFSDGRT